MFDFYKTDSNLNKTLSSKSLVWFCDAHQRNKCEEKANDTITSGGVRCVLIFVQHINVSYYVISWTHILFDGNYCTICKDVLLLEVRHTSDLID